MFFSKASVLVTLAYSASFANAQDCGTDIQSDQWTKFYSSLETGKYDFSQFPKDCLDIEGDVFTYSGTTTCNGDVEQIVNVPHCVPATCVPGGSGAFLPAIIAFEESCTGEYTYEGLGAGTPPSIQCTLVDMGAIEKDPTDLIAFSTARVTAELMGSDDYSALPGICEGIEGMHYFTFDGTYTCDDTTKNRDVTGVPMCLPESCTDGDEATLTLMVTAVEDDVYEGCTLSGLTSFDLKDKKSSGAFSHAATSVVTAGVTTIVTGLTMTF